jgi:hypothetical protein
MSQAGLLNVSGGGGGGSPIESIEGNDGIPVPPTGNIIHIVGAGGVLVSGNPGTSTLTITVPGSVFTWNVITSANNVQQISVQNGYITKGAMSCIMLLPASANIGDTFEILGYGNLWQLTQNAGQTIFYGKAQTTSGVGGSLTATMIKDRIEVICVTANTEFDVTTSIGNITVV